MNEHFLFIPPQLLQASQNYKTEARLLAGAWVHQHSCLFLVTSEVVFLWQVKVTSAHSTPRLGHSRVSVIEHPVLSFIVLMPQGSLKDFMFDLYYTPLFQDSFLSKHSDFPLTWYSYFVVILNALANKDICNELSQMFFFSIQL